MKTAAQQLNRREIIVPVCWTPTAGYAKLNKGVSNVIKDKLHFNVFLMLSISIRMYIPPKWRPISKETTLALWWKVRPSVSTTSGRAGHHTPAIDKTIYASGIHFKTFWRGVFPAQKYQRNENKTGGGFLIRLEQHFHSFCALPLVFIRLPHHPSTDGRLNRDPVGVDRWVVYSIFGPAVVNWEKEDVWWKLKRKAERKQLGKSLFIYFYFSKRRKQFQIGLFSLFFGLLLDSCGRPWESCGPEWNFSSHSSTKKQTDRMKK